MIVLNDNLKHHGIKGQKWGVRRFQNKDGSLTPAGRKRQKVQAHEDYNRAHSGKSVKEMSDKELRDVNNRLNMERQYAQMTTKKGIGSKFVTGVLAVVGTELAKEYVKKYAKAGIEKVPEMIGNTAANYVIKKGKI